MGFWVFYRMDQDTLDREHATQGESGISAQAYQLLKPQEASNGSHASHAGMD
jgi:hypothetical protein